MIIDLKMVVRFNDDKIECSQKSQAQKILLYKRTVQSYRIGSCLRYCKNIESFRCKVDPQRS